MISVIVCSYNKTLFNNLSVNIAETIGVPFEIIRIDNSSNTYGVCSAYNEGAAKAMYDILCFAHEDIQLITKDWGKKVTEILAGDQKIGLIGIAGGGYKTFAPSTWTFASASLKTVYINMTQVYKYLDRPPKTIYENPREEVLSDVAAVDGVWFCTTKTIAREFRFDEEIFKGFHCYDADFSLSVLQKFRVVVSFEILLEHFSEGRNDKKWINDVLKLHKKWDSKFPINLDNIPLEVQKSEEIKAYGDFYRTMLNEGYLPPAIISRINFNSKRQPLSKEEISEIKFEMYKYAAKRMAKLLLNKTKLFKYQV